MYDFMRLSKSHHVVCIARVQYFFYIGMLLSNIEVESFLIHCNGHHAQHGQSKMTLFQNQKVMHDVVREATDLQHQETVKKKQQQMDCLVFIFLMNGEKKCPGI